jgi:hypothetical protein
MTTETCPLCDRPLDADEPSGLEFHPACWAQRAPGDALVAVVAALALMLAPAIVVWAG